MRILVVIPARGGSKGLPGKNVKPLCGKPLIYYSIDIARYFVEDEDICVSTDDLTIKDIVEKYSLRVPFLRPSELASDTATTNDVLQHAIDYYRLQGKTYDIILLLQPTSPLRSVEQVRDALSIYNETYDMIVSVNESHSAAVICNENKEGFLFPTLTQATRRQDVETYYEYNGAIYIINVNSLLIKGLSKFDKQIKFVMSVESSIDIDTPLDWYLTECIIKKRENEKNIFNSNK